MGWGGRLHPCMTAIMRKHAISRGVFIIGKIAARYNERIANARTIFTNSDGIGAGTFFSLYNGYRPAAGIIM